MKADPYFRACMAKGDFFKMLQAASRPEFTEKQVQDATDLLHDVRAYRPHHVAYNTVACSQGATVAEALGITSTMITMQMMVAVSGKELPPMLVSPELGPYLPACAVRMCWHVMLWIFAKSPVFKTLDREFRCKILNVPALSDSQFRDRILGNVPGCSVVIARSPLLSPPPADWSDKHKECLSGAFVLSAEQQLKAWPASAELLAFLERCDVKKTKPIYFGWGSMIAGSPTRMIELAVRALKAVGRSGVVLSGWAGLDLGKLKQSEASDASELISYASEYVYFLTEPSIPHEWLFPKMDCIVHHGGAGTTASALRAGVPSIITPCAFDQPELGEKVKKAGVGLRLPQFHVLKDAELLMALDRALNDMTLRGCAADFGSALREEAGATIAANHIATRLKEPCLPCETTEINPNGSRCSTPRSTTRSTSTIYPAASPLQEVNDCPAVAAPQGHGQADQAPLLS